MKEKRLVWQLYPSYLLVILVSLVLMFFYASHSFKSFYLNQTTRDLRARTTLMEKQVLAPLYKKNISEINDMFVAQGKEIGTRFTLVDITGFVLADSDENPDNMDNHLNRPEMQDALNGGWGISIRESQTLETTMLYISKPIWAESRIIGVIRSSIPINELDVTLGKLKKTLVTEGLLICLFSALIGFFVSRKITRPIQDLTDGADKFSEGDFDFRLNLPQIREFRTLAVALNNMASQLKDRMRTIEMQANEKEQMRKNFVGNVSHELKTPVTLIKGFLETLSRGAAEDKTERDEFLSIIGTHANRIDDIIDDLLTLSRIEQGEAQSSIDLGEENVGEVVLKAISACQKRADEKGVALRFELKEPVKAEINFSLMEQALINLIENALKHSEAQSDVTIELAQTDTETCMSVSDSGCGISAKHIGHLFERFYRVDKARSRDLGGTGLGLAIVKHIAQAHNGTVSVTSVEGDGSCFVIKVPRPFESLRDFTSLV